MHVVQLTQHEIEQVIQFVLQYSGNDFTEKSALVGSKINLLCNKLGYHHFYEMWDDMHGPTIKAGQLRQQVIDELMTSYSYFYREHSHFTTLAKLISAGNLPTGDTELRAWSAGCASGEEAYNIAMVCEDARNTGLLMNGYQVIGSDISSKAINVALSAHYDVANVARMPPHWRNQYCMHSGREYDIRGHVRKHVEFRCESVLAARMCAPFDIVMCRNMIIYFNRETIGKFCSLLYSKIKPNGYLILGHTEILSDLPGFTYIEPSLWRKNPSEGDDFLSLFAPR